MDVMRGEVEKERVPLLPLDEGECLPGEGVGHLLVFPQRRLPSLHESDATDAVDNSLIVLVAPVHRERAAVSLPRRLPGIGLLVIHEDGIPLQFPDNMVVLDKNARHTVTCGGHDEGVIETHLQRARLDLPIPVGTSLPASQAKMPFADDPGAVTGLPQQGGQRGATRFDDEGRVAWKDVRAFLSEGIFTGQQRISGGGAGCGGGIGAREAQSLGSQTVDMRRLDRGCAVATEIAVADVIPVNENNVGIGSDGGTHIPRQQERQQTEDGANLRRLHGHGITLPQAKTRIFSRGFCWSRRGDPDSARASGRLLPCASHAAACGVPRPSPACLRQGRDALPGRP